MDTKDTNPKTQYGVKKPSMWYVPSIPLYMTALAHFQGALKYGVFNWREKKVSASTYIDAAQRHLNEFKEGISDEASDTGIHHLAHAVACLNILMDAQHHNTLIDDRKTTQNEITKTDFDSFYKKNENLIARIIKDWTKKGN